MWKNIINQGYKGYKVEVKELPTCLARNENPYDLPKDIKKEILDKLMESSWNRYPDSKAQNLKRALSEFIGIGEEYFLLGDGSGEVISIIANALLKPKDKVILPQPTFPLYSKIFLQKDVDLIEIILNREDFSFPWEKFKNYLKDNIKLLVFCNPNNPTGNLLINYNDLEKLKEFQGFILIDEAYYEFSDITFLKFLKDFPNLLILRTFSKAFSCAGIRLGYLMANPEIIEYLENYRLPYNLNLFSQIAGEIVLKYWEILKERIKIIKEQKEFLFNELKRINNIIVYPSYTNFLLIRSMLKENIEKNLNQKGIAVRDFSKEILLENTLRVTIGDEYENKKFLECIHEVINEKSRS
ncbi:MAG: histidinol-phosphate transaminase [Dictyoglomaceae bacterium]|nr:histidinol-phosphate transaminase [Dictyoglomaceae bacterium]